MNKKTIVFTGGGSAGHVTPNLAIIDELDRDEWNIHYIGSKSGIEREMIEGINIPYHPISSGKLRRYFDFENMKDALRVIKGVFGARSALRKIKPKLIFSKGGFVSVPVILAAKSLGIPSFIHESDLTPGLANRIAQRFATKIFTSFSEAAKHFPASKTEAIGSPIRKDILAGSKADGLALLGFTTAKPVMLVMGGSLGAKKINEVVRKALPNLTAQYQVVHLCGKGNKDEQLANSSGYVQFEFITEELADILAATDLTLTRGGSNAIFEFLALKIPMIIIPLPKTQSRGDQILNAENFTANGFAMTLTEEEMTMNTVIEAVQKLKDNRSALIEKMSQSQLGNGLERLLQEIEQVFK